MSQPITDPTFYRRAAAAAAAPPERLAYVAAFDRAADKPDAMSVIDVDPGSDTMVGWWAGPRFPGWATSCT